MRYGHRDEVSWLELDGAVKYTRARALRRFVDDVLLPSVGDTTIVDLRRVSFVDSTGLGLLARIGRHCLERLGRRAVLVCPQGAVSEGLKAVCFDRLFTLAQDLDVPPDCPLSPIPEEQLGRDGLAEVMLDAHRELSTVDGGNSERFREVVSALEEAEHPKA